MRNKQTTFRRTTVKNQLWGENMDDDFASFMTIPHDLFLVTKTIPQINAASDQLNTLASKTNGDHLYGHQQSVQIIRSVNHTLKQRLSNENTLADELKGRQPFLNNPSLRLIKIPQPGLSKFCLAYINGRGQIPVLTRILAGDNALVREHPLLPVLVHDKTQYYVDATLFKPSHRSHGWYFMRLIDTISRQAWLAHHLIEYLGIYPLAMIAKKIEASNILSLVAIWLLLEWNADWNGNPEAGFGVPESGLNNRTSTDEALHFLLREYPLPIEADCAWRPPRSFRDEYIAFIEKALTPAKAALRKKMTRQGGAMPERSAFHLIMACDWKPEQIPADLVNALLRIDQKLTSKVQSLKLAIKGSLQTHRISPQRDFGRFSSARRAIEPADLLAPSAVRAMAAMKLVQDHHWTPFVARFADLYEGDEELPGAPMPHSGLLPLNLRLTAAGASTLLAKALDGKVDLPSHLFGAENFLRSPDPEAHKAIYHSVNLNFRRYLAFQEVAQAAPTTTEAWLTWIESIFLYSGGCGLDSVTDLIFPAFFFSTHQFEMLLRYEKAEFKKVWLEIRNRIGSLYDFYQKRRYHNLKDQFKCIFRQIATLNLRQMQTIGADADNEPPPVCAAPGQTDPFERPANVFSEKHLVIDEASAPIAFEQIAGGNPAALQHAVSRLKPYISMLKHLHVHPSTRAPRLRGRFAHGLDFDLERLDALMVGDTEAPFCNIDYRPAERTDVRYTLRVLQDYSGSMNQERVRLAKDFALTLGMGLRTFDVILYLYATKGSFYQLIECFDSRKQRLGGQHSLASICDEKYSAGWGWNPDGAALLAIQQLIVQETGPAARNNLIVYLGDMEFCSSLKPNLAPDLTGEVVYACQKLITSGHCLVIGRCGTDLDPIPQEKVPHGYLHLPETGISKASVLELYSLIMAAVRHLERDGN